MGNKAYTVATAWWRTDTRDLVSIQAEELGTCKRQEYMAEKIERGSAEEMVGVRS